MTTSPTVIRNVTPNIATFSRPFSRFGLFPIGGRSTAVKLNTEGGGVWVLASTPLDEPTKSKLAEMGPVKYVVAGDYVHHLFVGEYAKAYPDAKVIGVEGLGAKRTDVKFAGEYGRDASDTKYGFEEEIVAQYFPTFSNKDVAFLHKDSKTLIVVDLLFNLPCNEQYKNTPNGKASSWIPGMQALSKKFAPTQPMHKNFLWNTSTMNDVSAQDKKTSGTSTATSTEERRKFFARNAEAVAAWDFDKIIPCHGDTIESNGKQAWLDAYSRFLGSDGKSKI